MAHNTTLNPGVGGDTAATYDLSAGGAPPATGKAALALLVTAPSNTATPAAVSGVNPLYVSSGGSVATPVPAGTTTSVVVCKAAPGRLGRVVVIASGSQPISLYDNASAATGTVLLTIPSTAVQGAIYDVQMPAANGITAGQVSGSPQLLVGTF